MSNDKERKAGDICPVTLDGRTKTPGQIKRERNLVQNRRGYTPPSSESMSALGKKGGRASKKAFDERKSLRETMETVMDMYLKPGPGDDIEYYGSMEEILENEPNFTVSQQLVLVVVLKAMCGDINAYRIILDILGEPRKEVVVDVPASEWNEADLAKEEKMLEAFEAFLAEHPEYDWRLDEE